MMQTEVKCPLTGLDVIETEAAYKLGYSRQHKPIYYYGIDRHSELSSLTQNEKGKLLQWLVQTIENKNKKDSETVFIPDKFICKIDRDVDSPLNKTITPTQKLEWLLEYIYKGEETVGLSKEISNQELFPYLATVEVKEVG
jgi:hypothetical protein